MTYNDARLRVLRREGAHRIIHRLVSYMSVQVACPQANIRASNLSPCRRVVSWDCHESDNFIFAICEFGFSYLLQRFLQENERPEGTFLLEGISRGMVAARANERERKR